MSKSLMLKDYLLEDLSSCSSNGFRSFPRRQCCTTTVRFLLEIDLRVTDSSLTKRFSPARIASRKIAISTIATLQKASDAVFRAFKQFPFPSSRKLILRPFWKKSDVKPCKSFQEFLDEKEPPSFSDRDLAVAGRNSISSISWTESEFTLEMIPSSSSGISESCSENDAVKDGEVSPGDLVGESDGVMFGEDSLEESTAAVVTAAAYREESVKEWGNGEEKEQLSPVSVLDFPFDLDEDKDNSSSFNSNLHLIQGKKQKHHQKTKKIEKGAELEPIDLKKRFEDLNFISKKEHQREQKALELLTLLKSSSSSSTNSQSFINKTEILLLDFFDEKLEQIELISRRVGGGSDFEQDVLKLTQEWIRGGGGEMMIVGWESPEGRKLYIQDMEMAGMWRSFAGEEEELAAGVEAEIWMSLLNELLIDLS